MHLRTKILIIIVISSNLLWADPIEDLLNNESESDQQSELVEQLEYYSHNKLNINKASIDELRIFFWLDESELESIISHRKSKKFDSIRDLKKLNIQDDKIDDLSIYIKFSQDYSLKFYHQNRIELMTKELEDQHPLKFIQKTDIRYNNFRWGFLNQKDPQESSFIDFYSYYAEYKNSNLHLILGKYRTYLGQGIILSNKLGISKSAAATGINFNQSDIFKPYTSSYESWEFQGLAAEYRKKFVNLAFWGSFNQLSANLSDGLITSFNDNGLHYEGTEKDNIDETVYGAISTFSFQNSKIDLYLLNQEFSHKFVSEENRYTAYGASFFLFRNFLPIFGEVANANDKLAFTIGSRWGNNILRQLIQFRSYPEGFPTWHGNPFSSSSNFSNENGFYYGITYAPLKKVKINAYFDIWKHPYPRYIEKMPTTNSDMLVQIEYKQSHNKFRLYYKYSQKENQVTLDESLICDTERTTYRFDLSQEIKPFTLKNRVEFSTEYLPTEKIWDCGKLFYSQLSYNNDKIQLIGRVAVYHSEVLLYMYENNVSGIMQNRILSGDGITSFFLLKAKILRQFELQFRISNELTKKDQMQFILQLIMKI